MGAGDYVCAEVMITNKRGLHARASAKFVKCAEKYDAKILVTRDGQTVGGTSIMGLMMLAAAQGSSIVMEAEGRQAQDALAALMALIQANFDEDE